MFPLIFTFLFYFFFVLTYPFLNVIRVVVCFDLSFIINNPCDKLTEMLYIATHGDENTPQYSSIEAATSHLKIEIPCTQVGQTVYEGELTLNPENSLFELAPNIREIEIAPSMRCGKFYDKTLYLPCVESIDETYWGNFNLIENSSPTQFYLWEYGAAECTE